MRAGGGQIEARHSDSRLRALLQVAQVAVDPRRSSRNSSATGLAISPRTRARHSLLLDAMSYWSLPPCADQHCLTCSETSVGLFFRYDVGVQQRLLYYNKENEIPLVPRP